MAIQKVGLCDSICFGFFPGRKVAVEEEGGNCELIRRFHTPPEEGNTSSAFWAFCKLISWLNKLSEIAVLYTFLNCWFCTLKKIGWISIVESESPSLAITDVFFFFSFPFLCEPDALSSSLTLSMSLLFRVFGLTSFPYLSHISMASLKPEMKPLTSFPESQKQREKKEKENKSRYFCPPEPGNLTRPLFRRTRLWFRICSSSAAIPREIKKRSEEAFGLVLAINQENLRKIETRSKAKGQRSIGRSVAFEAEEEGLCGRPEKWDQPFSKFEPQRKWKEKKGREWKC